MDIPIAVGTDKVLGKETLTWTWDCPLFSAAIDITLTKKTKRLINIKVGWLGGRGRRV